MKASETMIFTSGTGSVLRKAAVVAAVLLSACGCASATHWQDTAGPSEAAPLALRDPLAPYLPSPSEQAVMAAGLRDEVALCLRDHGFAVPAELQVEPSPLIAGETNLVAISGWLTLPVAKRFGYLEPTGSGQVLDIISGWSATYAPSSIGRDAQSRLREVLIGSGAGGCLEAGIDTLIGIATTGAHGRTRAESQRLVAQASAAPLNLRMEADWGMQKSRQVARVTALWRRCMSSERYTYSSPDAAESDPRWLAAAGRGDSMSEQISLQVPVASADARCRVQVNYARVRLIAFSSDLRTLIADVGMRHRLQQFRALVARWVQSARRDFPALQDPRMVNGNGT